MRITPSICLVATKTRDVKTYTSETPILTIHDQGLPLRGVKETKSLLAPISKIFLQVLIATVIYFLGLWIEGLKQEYHELKIKSPK